MGKINIPQNPMESYKNNYQKLGGFLLVIVIISIIIIFINVIAFITYIYKERELFQIVINTSAIALKVNAYVKNFVDISRIINAFSLLVSIFTIIFLVNLFQRKLTFLRFAQLAMLLNVQFNVCAIINNSILLYRVNEFIDNFWIIQISIITGVLGIIISFVIINFITLYMSKSVRVLTYMGSDEFLKKALFVFTRKH